MAKNVSASSIAIFTSVRSLGILVTTYYSFQLHSTVVAEDDAIIVEVAVLPIVIGHGAPNLSTVASSAVSYSHSTDVLLYSDYATSC